MRLGYTYYQHSRLFPSVVQPDGRNSVRFGIPHDDTGERSSRAAGASTSWPYYDRQSTGRSAWKPAARPSAGSATASSRTGGRHRVRPNCRDSFGIWNQRQIPGDKVVDKKL